jgi:hypothetical protein
MGSSPLVKTIGMVVVAAFAHCDLRAHELARECRQSIHLTFCPAVFDRHVLPFNIAGLAQSLAERG